MLYYNMQKNLTKNVKDYEQFNVVPDTMNIYRAIEVAAPTDVYLHMYQFKANVEAILAYALTTGCNVTLEIESINAVLNLQHFDVLEPKLYRFYDKKNVYDYIKDLLKPYRPEMTVVDREINYLRDKNNNSQYFQVTDEIKKFIRTYAPAYGISIPKFEETAITSDNFLPKHWFKLYKDICEKSPDVQKALISWDLSEKAHTKATPLYEIERIFDSLMFYVRNNIPFNDNYIKCPQCGKPMRTNSWGATELLEHTVCSDCDPDYNRTEVTSASFDESYMRPTDNCGHKVTVEKNVLDA